MDLLPRVRRAGEGLQPQQLELTRGQRASLVEANDLYRGQRLERLRVLDQQPVPPCQERQRRALHERRRAEQRARAAGDDDHQELLHALVAPQDDREDEDDGGVPGGEAADDLARVRG